MQPPIGIRLQQNQAEIIESQIVKTEAVDHGYGVSTRNTHLNNLERLSFQRFLIYIIRSGLDIV